MDEALSENEALEHFARSQNVQFVDFTTFVHIIAIPSPSHRMYIHLEKVGEREER